LSTVSTTTILAREDEPQHLYTKTLKDSGADWAGFSADGAKIFILTNEIAATGKSRRLVLVWDAKTGKQIQTLSVDGTGSHGSVSSDGKWFVMDEFSKDPTVRDMKDGSLVATLTGHKGDVLAARFSPDAAKVVTGSSDKSAKIWDATNGKCLMTLQGHTLPVASAEFSPDGKRVVTGSYAGEIKIWDVEKGECLISLSGMSTSNNPTSFTADGKQVVSPRLDTPAVWTVGDGKLVQEFKGHKSWVRTARFDPTGKRIVTAGLDKTVRVWDVATGKELFVLPGHVKEAKFAEFSPDGSRILTVGTDLRVNVWQVPTVK
jgi:WD40 repeat protein